MKTFNAPAVEIDKFMLADVIAASAGEETEEEGGSWLPDDRG